MTQFETGKNYCYLVELGSEKFMTLWERDRRVFASYFTVRKR